MPLLRAANRTLDAFFRFGAGVSMAGVFGIIFVNSVRRYTVGKSLEWGEELPIYLAIYGVMFGCALAYRQDRHIRFTILTDFFPERLRTWCFALVDLAMVGVGGLLAYSGYLFLQKRGDVEASGLITSVKGLAADLGAPWIEALGHLAFWQFSMVLGGVILALAALCKGIERGSVLLRGGA